MHVCDLIYMASYRICCFYHGFPSAALLPITCQCPIAPSLPLEVNQVNFLFLYAIQTHVTQNTHMLIYTKLTSISFKKVGS